jgi:hypothetical protein
MKKTNTIKELKKAATLFAICSLFITGSCKKEKTLDTVSNISVSQGTYMGVVHITWDGVSDASYYNIERQGPDGNWIAAGTVSGSPFDDFGLGLPDNKLQAGVKYNYRITSASSDLDDSGYADAPGQGWMYEIKPIQLTVTRDNSGNNTLNWSDPNQDLINYNLVGFSYKIKRKYENETEFTDIFTTDKIATAKDMTYVDNTVANDKKATYSIEGMYDYGYKNMDYGDFVGYWSNQFAAVEETGGSLQANYNTTFLNSFPAAIDGYSAVWLKNINSEMYAAVIPKPVFGAPVVYKLNGTSWQNISTSYPDGLQKNYEKISFCGDGTTVWAGGVSKSGINDSAYLYSYNGSWSNNLVSKNLGLNDIPDNLLVEYANSTLYALCYHDQKLELFTNDQGSQWTSSGSVEDNVSVLDLGFRKFNNKLYVYYLSYNTSQNSTLNIKHLEGSTWQTDFSKAYDYMMNISVNIDGSGNIYFTSQSEDINIWQGNVFKVTSSSTADELVSSPEDWQTLPSDIAFDNLGKPVVLFLKIVSLTDPYEMHLAVYDNNAWKEISGDFTNLIMPADLESDNDLYFVYGDNSDITTTGSYPISLNAVILTSQ